MTEKNITKKELETMSKEKNKVAKLEKELKEEKDKAVELEKELKEEGNKVAELEKKLKEEENKVTELEKELKEEKDKVAELEKKLKEVEEEKATYWNSILRMKADFENYQKNTEKRLKEYEKISNEKIIKDLIEDLENFERVMEFARKNNDNLYESIKIIYDHFLSTMKKYGLEIIDSVGKPFDPECNEAVVVEEGDQDNLVVEEFSKGYKLNGILIKPSRVKVIKKR
ncbi:MAG: nucleotide exchange factor GrpE [Thermoplasmata archaeon]